jgi:serine protease inhibitor
MFIKRFKKIALFLGFVSFSSSFYCETNKKNLNFDKILCDFSRKLLTEVQQTEVKNPTICAITAARTLNIVTLFIKDNEQRDKLRKFLGFGPSNKTVNYIYEHMLFEQYLENLPTRENTRDEFDQQSALYHTLKEFSSIFLQDKGKENEIFYNPYFLNFIKEKFNVELKDFDNPQKVADEINKIISEKTNGKITDLAKKEHFKRSEYTEKDATAVALSTLLVEDKWKENFFSKSELGSKTMIHTMQWFINRDDKNTRLRGKGPWYVTFKTKDSIKTRFSSNYYQSGPEKYKDQELSFILDGKGDGLHYSSKPRVSVAFKVKRDYSLSHLTYEELHSLINIKDNDRTLCKVEIPIINQENITNVLNLPSFNEGKLKSLKKGFTQNLLKDNKEKMKLSTCLQKNKVSFNSNGFSAASATMAVIRNDTGGREQPTNIQNIQLYHPFTYTIFAEYLPKQEGAKKTFKILYQGVVENTDVLTKYED